MIAPRGRTQEIELDAQLGHTALLHAALSRANRAAISLMKRRAAMKWPLGGVKLHEPNAGPRLGEMLVDVRERSPASHWAISR